MIVMMLCRWWCWSVCVSICGCWNVGERCGIVEGCWVLSGIGVRCERRRRRARRARTFFT